MADKNPFADPNFGGDAGGNPFADPNFGLSKSTGALRKAADIGLSVGKGVIGVPETAVGLADLVSGGAAGKAVEGLGVRFKDAKQVLTDLQSDDLKGKQQQFQQADGVVDKLGVALSNLAGSIVDSVLFLWLAFGVAAVTVEGVAGMVIGKAAMILPALVIVWWVRQRRVAVA